MSHTVPVDADDAAFLCRRYCDNAIAYLSAVGAKINHGNGLIEAVSAAVLSDLILRNLDHRLYEERERFESLRNESRDLMQKFWKFFQLFPIQNPDGTTSVAHIVSPAPHAVVRHVGEDKLHTNGSGKGQGQSKPGAHTYRKHIAPDERTSLRKQLQDGPYNQAELAAIAKERNLGFSTVSREYYKILAGR